MNKDLYMNITHMNLPYDEDSNWMSFNMGTCRGMFGITEHAYQIFGIGNSEPGNGHFDEVLGWFERNCARKNKDLVFEHFINEPFMTHLIEKRGYKPMSRTCVIKYIRKTN